MQLHVLTSFCEHLVPSNTYNCGLRAVVLLKDVSICYCHIKKEVEYVFVKLPAFGAAAIVATQLVASVHSSHVGIILKAWDRYSGAVTLSPLYGARSLGLSAR